MLSIIGFVLTISLLVFIHEFGHYYVAKIFGVKIEEFSIGFGKTLYSFIDRENVKWKICALPFGGFVKIYGYDKVETNQSIDDKDRAFVTKPLYVRFLIIAAGPIANYLLAAIIFASFYFILGKVELPAIIGEVVVNSPAARSGLMERDKVIKIDGKDVSNFIDLQRNILINRNQFISLLVERKGELIVINVTPEVLEGQSYNQVKEKKHYIGIVAKNEPIYIKMGVFGSLYQAFIDVLDISYLVLKALGQMLIGKRSLDEIGGPITIAKESGKSLAQGYTSFLLFIAILSVNLGLFNLLPIPVLDGGHLVFILYESIIGKEPHQYMRNISLRIGILMIIFLIVISISNDIKSLIF